MSLSSSPSIPPDSPDFVAHSEPSIIEFKKDGGISRMRSHKGNMPSLPQTKKCPHCPAKFTRTTHLNRHLRTHSNERMHRCDTCTAQFTRSDLLTRHKKSCGESGFANRSRRKSCQACADSKIKCDLQSPCSKCRSRNRECIYVGVAPSLTFSNKESHSPGMALGSPTGREFLMSGVGGPSTDPSNVTSFSQEFLTTAFPNLSIRENKLESPSGQIQGTIARRQSDITPPALSSESRSPPKFLNTFLSNVEGGHDTQIVTTSHSSPPVTTATPRDPGLAFSTGSSTTSSPTPSDPFGSPIHNRNQPQPVTDFASLFSSELDTLALQGHLDSIYSSDLEPFLSSLLASSTSSSYPSPREPFLGTPSSDDSMMVDNGWQWGFDVPDGGMNSDIMGQQAMSNQPREAFPFATLPVDIQPFMASIGEAAYDGLMNSTPQSMSPTQRYEYQQPSSYTTNISRGPDTGSRSPSDMPNPSHVSVPNLEPTPDESQHYMYLFFTAFLKQMPVMHIHTWNGDGKPAVLIRAMMACGALYVKTRKATQFVVHVLDSSRDVLCREFDRNPTDLTEQIQLIQAVALLQTIGLFHQKPHERASANIWHGMLVMLIRRSGLIAKNKAWNPPNMTNLDAAWREWANHESAKRALLLTYLHDTCHSLYFAMRPSFLLSEVDLQLACEGALWNASTANEWNLALQDPSPYGSMHQRLVGSAGMLEAHSSIADMRIPATPIPLNPWSHFIIIHTILRDLYTIGMENPASAPSNTPKGSGQVTQDVFALQYSLHNWLQSWLQGPEMPRLDEGEEPIFLYNALPFYWLAQVSILAYQEGLPPFKAGGASHSNVEVRFRLVKHWLRHIRCFLRRGEKAPTLFVDELMKVRLQTRNVDTDAGGGGAADDQDGLLGFFPEH
ncbi:hypothetical protein JAAARDRAFT_42772 [Jaapia argillacea MUCL 33604]|uniref:Zn(2)-C6 fungal-type domain-containing protein n=1 Tax=Jaapia argillacea MUCL 33604 TaxID=933084 RepID=A0A067P6V8_9AGAM|nr:hypothetical protein JAAARDRAFT_42772 [Jaapia argillacea MUCL 33604]